MARQGGAPEGVEYIDQEEEFMVDPATGAGAWVAVRAGSAPISPQQVVQTARRVLYSILSVNQLSLQVVQTASIAFASQLVHIPSPGHFPSSDTQFPVSCCRWCRP